MSAGLAKLRELRRNTAETVTLDADQDPRRIPARLPPPLRTKPQVDDPAQKLAKPLPPLGKANGSSLPTMPQSFFDQLRVEREEHRRWQIAQHEKKVKAGRRKRRRKKEVECAIPFGTWILGQWRRPDPVGDLVRAFYLQPNDSDVDHWQAKLEAVGAKKQHFKALIWAQDKWIEECRLPATDGRNQKAVTKCST